jgi:cadmium resistance transport/sequestration family protein
MIKEILIAVITYIATSVDEIPVLFLLYTDSSNKGKGKTITTAYFAGTFLLVGAGLLGAFGLIQIPLKWIVGLIGLLPLAMGIRILFKGDDDEEEATALERKQKSLLLQVLIITLALGADDLGVYIPLFTTLTLWQIVTMIVTFAVGTAILCFISYRLTHIELLKEFIERRERFIVGLVFIAVGILVLAECGTFSKLIGMFM